jgi:DAK2 domain fusion protein YloV
MTTPRSLTPHYLITDASEALEARKEEVNRLNVFPVPDGDTGTNMALTMASVVGEIQALPHDAPLPVVCHAVTHGSLMGARGNSGVILSQMLRGLCEVLATTATIDPETLAGAFENAVKVAFQAVRKPVEGTMLTVLRDTSEAVRQAQRDGCELHAVLTVLTQASKDSVRRTPDLLPVLKEAGVVDAGGFGLAIIAEGLVAAFEGHDVQDFDVTIEDGMTSALEPVNDWDDEEFLYCTEFLLIGDELDRDEIESCVSAAGGSELVVGDGGVVKVHDHTDDPGSVIAHAT